MRNIVIEDNFGLLQLDNPHFQDASGLIESYSNAKTVTPLSLQLNEILIHSGNIDPDILAQIPDQRLQNQHHIKIGNAASPLPAQVLADSKLMDILRRQPSVLNPIVLSAEAAELAKELQAGMVMRTSSVNDVSQVYPTRDFLEENPPTVLNSKAAQVEIFAELDRQNGTNYIPESHVVRNNSELTDAVLRLLQQHRGVMLKENLSTGGNGVTRFFKDYLEQIAIQIKTDVPEDTLSAFTKSQEITYGEKNPLVVQEFIPMVISNPSIEMFVPPPDGFNGRGPQAPWVTYAGDMIIQAHSYLGIRIPDPLLVNPQTKGIHERQRRYCEAFEGLVSAALKIAKYYQEMGYVGIMDCDCGIAINEREEIFGKIFESNLGRETGGTLPHLLLKKAGLGIKSAAIQVLNLQWGSDAEYSPKEVIQRLNSHGYQSKRGGFIVTSVTPDYRLFSGIGIATTTKKTAQLINEIVKTCKKI